MCTLPVRSSENTKPVGPRHKQNMQAKIQIQNKIPKTENLEKPFQGNKHIFNNTTKYENTVFLQDSQRQNGPDVFF